MSPALDVIGVPDPAQWSPAVFSGVAVAVPLSRRAAAACCPARKQDDGYPRGLPQHDRRARGPPFLLIFREKEGADGKGKESP
jgi:hypothetical protein